MMNSTDSSTKLPFLPVGSHGHFWAAGNFVAGVHQAMGLCNGSDQSDTVCVFPVRVGDDRISGGDESNGVEQNI
jgi:hypothetical protein